MTDAVADRWTPALIPDQTGRTALVTGPSPGGLGQFTALELARHGARVVLAGRNEAKLSETLSSIRAEVPNAELERLVVDLSTLDSVRRAAKAAAVLGPLHLLVNNAGVMAPPYQRTVDGLELQMATNHFGPFLLTGLLLPQLAEAGSGGAPARVVTVSSLMHRRARHAPLDDPRTPRGQYHRWPEYSESKLANLLFTHELDRRARAKGVPVRAVAAHPGISATHLVANGRTGDGRGPVAMILDAATRAVAQSAEQGAWPVLMAATADLPGGSYCGPSGWGQFSGPPRVVGSTPLARDEMAQRRLWEISEQTVGLRYP